jgi:hypothetical protein
VSDEEKRPVGIVHIHDLMTLGLSCHVNGKKSDFLPVEIVIEIGKM